MIIKIENLNGNIVCLPGNQFFLQADDGRDLFALTLSESGELLISAGMICKHNNEMLDTSLSIIPKSSNSIIISRDKYV